MRATIVAVAAIMAVLVSATAASLLQTPVREGWVTRHLEERRTASSFAAVMSSMAPTDKMKLAAISCGECKDIMAIVEAIGNETAQQENKTLAMVDFLCELKFSNSTKEVAICKLLGAVALDVAHLLVKGLAHALAWDFPLTMCSNIVPVCKQPCCAEPNVPEQMQLSFASQQVVGESTSMRVSWVTLAATPGAVVQWRAANSGSAGWNSAGEQSRTYHRGGWIGMIHSSVMQPLLPGVSYEYRVGVVAGVMSNVSTFTTLPLNAGTAQRPLRVLTFGDMGYGPQSTDNRARLTAAAKAGSIDFIIHHGDVSYADGDEQHWDIFFRELQPVTSRIPYMTTPGNHELYWNFTAYRTRMWMPMAGDGAPSDALYYNFNAAGFKFLAVDTETEIDTPNVNAAQRTWIDKQLSASDAAGEAAIVFQHRPLYCSNHGDACGLWATLLQSQVEPILMQHRSVRLVCSAHIHDYERTDPVCAGGNNISHSLINPPYPVHVVNGAGGNRENVSRFRPGPPPWSVKRVSQWGLNHLTLFSNNTAHTINSRFILGADGSTADTFTIVQSK